MLTSGKGAEDNKTENIAFCLDRMFSFSITQKLKNIVSVGSFHNFNILQSSNIFNYQKLFQMSTLNGASSIIEPDTAGIIVIGNEILKGQIQDTNSHFLCSQLYKLGVKVEKISVISDDIDIIANEVSNLSKKYTYVITSGGIGPTHDDVTFEGVAKAFEESTEAHPTIVNFIKDWFKTDDMTSPAFKMAYIPKSSVLHFGEDKKTGIKSRFPVITVKNVTVFPGIPHLLEKGFSLIGKDLFQSNCTQFHCSQLYLNTDEVTLAPVLNESVVKFPDVTFGSYPELFHSYYKTKVTMDTLNLSSMERASQFLQSNLDKGHFVDYKEDTITDPYVYIEALMEAQPSIKPYILESMEVLSECFEKYKPEEICLCYNGGKDCLVVLHLTYALMTSKYPDHKLQAVYIPEMNSFPQVVKFVDESIVRYNLDCEIINGSMKLALSNLLAKRNTIQAVIMGTRRMDPHAKSLEFFSPTDGDWPAMMRVNPIINWEYNHIWTFIRGLFLPYCSLYDQGYTSIGGQDNTLPNPLLESKDKFDRVTFLPAHMLKKTEFERKGRNT